jgi:thiamine pyrophosphokinase
MSAAEGGVVAVVAVLHKSPLLLLEQSGEEGPDERVALIVLNAPIAKPPSPLFRKLWRLSQYTVCADGGANRLYDAAAAAPPPSSQQRDDYVPHLITGDLDSLRQRVRSYYEEQNVSVIRVDDQDTNDLEKAVKAVQRHFRDEPVRIVVYGAFGGRFDQEMASLQALHKYENVWLYSDQTMAVLLPANCANRIELALPSPASDESHVGEGPTCGLIPLGGPADCVTTTGLRWNLDGQPTAFGGLVSTSNRIERDVVTVKASHPLVFTAEVHSGRTAAAHSP